MIVLLIRVLNFCALKYVNFWEIVAYWSGNMISKLTIIPFFFFFLWLLLRPLLSVPVLPWLPWSQNWLLKQEIMWWRYIFWVFIVFMHLYCTHVCINLFLSRTMKILAGHLRVLCFTKWSNRCCQSSDRQPYHSLMCNSSNKVFLNWKIYAFWITFLNCLLFGKTLQIT